MKINDKNLVVFAASDSPVDKEGWLLKRGEFNKSFQRRWFILKGNLLFYYEKKTDREPIGVIILEGCTIELAENEEQYTFKIVFHGAGDRTYVLAAETQETMETWMKSLACASYDYMKLMVSELQRQLDEILEAEKSQSLALIAGNSNPEPVREVITKDLGAISKKSHRPPQIRTNPFNRCQSEGDFENQDSVDGVQTFVFNSAPGTPQIQRHDTCPNPPPRRYPRRTEEIARTSGAAATAQPPVASKAFTELHSRFGIQILNDIEVWQKQKEKPTNSVPVVSPSEPLITFD